MEKMLILQNRFDHLYCTNPHEQLENPLKVLLLSQPSAHSFSAFQMFDHRYMDDLKLHVGLSTLHRKYYVCDL